MLYITLTLCNFLHCQLCSTKCLFEYNLENGNVYHLQNYIFTCFLGYKFQPHKMYISFPEKVRSILQKRDKSQARSQLSDHQP